MIATKRYSSMFAPDNTPLTQLPQWQALVAHAATTSRAPLRNRLEEPDRFARLSRRHGDVLMDFSKQRLGEDTLGLLLDLANARHLRAGIDAMAAGDAINTTERRAALHIALRARHDAPCRVNGQNVMPEVLATREKVAAFAHALAGGEIKGATGKAITHVVNLGIGGSDLGPRMAAKAMAEGGAEKVQVSFVSSPDPLDLALALEGANAEETMFIVSSKSFSTAETLANAKAARAWLQAALPAKANWQAHFAAITNHLSAAAAFGIAAERCFAIPEWVGGRFSLWSAIGLPLAAAFGMTRFDALLAGARDMDEHFLSAPFEQNLPVLMALIGLWNIDFLNISSLGVLPYRHALRHLPAYLQQLEMESNGKSVTHAGQPVGAATAPVIWGCAGPLGQHAFHQLFFQGNQAVAIDFVVPVDAADDAHQLMVTQSLAQSASLARGKTLTEASAELHGRGLSEQDVATLAPHLACAGNVPSTTLMLPGLSPYTLGQLLALYEHKVFAQGWLWGVNSFDQFGVEYGKTMARDIASGEGLDSSTAGLWRHAEALMGSHRG